MSQPVQNILAQMGADLHVHVLPGIDDGAATLHDSLALLDLHYQAGIRRIVATPHIHSDFFRNTPDSIHAAWEKLQPLAEERWPDLQLTYAAEYYGNDYLLALLDTNTLLPLFDRYLLVETSMFREQPHFPELIAALIDKGWKPVLAHPERYRTWHNQPGLYSEMYEMNVIFQVNLLSLGGAYGSAEKAVAEMLIQQGMAGALGTDLHRAADYRFVHKAVQNPSFQLLNDMPLLNRTVPHPTTL
jgi:protein-tyrosine phosphatase